MEHAVK